MNTILSGSSLAGPTVVARITLRHTLRYFPLQLLELIGCEYLTYRVLSAMLKIEQLDLLCVDVADKFFAVGGIEGVFGVSFQQLPA